VTLSHTRFDCAQDFYIGIETDEAHRST